MSKYVRIIYLYIVAVISIFLYVFGLVFTVGNMVAAVIPTDPELYSYPYSSEYNSITDYNKAVEDFKSKHEIRIKAEKKKEIKYGITSVVVFAVGTVLYSYHSNLIEKERKEEVE